MNWPAYSDYRETDVDWLGSTPSSWSVERLSWLFDDISSGTTPESGNLVYYDGEINWVTTGELRERGISQTEKRVTPKALATYSALKVYPAGTLLIAMYGATIGRLGWLDAPACTNQACCAFANPKRVSTRFAYYALSAARNHLIVLASGGGQPNINQDKLRSLRIAVPSRSEQVAIVRFLDREIAKIDSLIAKQEQLIATLREDRTATITYAVTKGLDPDVELRDSGSPWIGFVPKHWDALAMKRIAIRITDGAHISPDTEGGVYDFVSTRDVSDKGIDFTGSLKTTPASYEYLVRNGCKPGVGDLLFSKDGTVGRTVVVSEDREFVVASSLIIIKCDRQFVDPWFAHYLCQASNTQQQVDSYVKGAGLPRLSISNLRKVIITRPPTDEQLEIVAFLNDRCSSIDALVGKADNVVDRLREYRSALITDAVTGKIDVRGVA